MVIESDRIVTATSSEVEKKQDWVIRPQTFDEYCGQSEASEQMKLFIKSLSVLFKKIRKLKTLVAIF